jgi:hypothetical protein
MPKVGGFYKYDPVPADRLYWGNRAPKVGMLVKCVKPAGNIGKVPARFKFISTVSGQFIGMVMTESLVTLTAAERNSLKGKNRRK